MQTQRVLKESSATPGDFEKPSTDQSLVYQRNKRQIPSSYPSNFPLNDRRDSSKVNHLQICVQELVLSNFHSFCSSLYSPPSQSSVQAKPISIFISYWTEFGIPQCYYYICNPFPTQWVALPLLEPDEDNIVQMWDLFLNLIIPKMTRENALSIPVIGLGWSILIE